MSDVFVCKNWDQKKIDIGMETCEKSIGNNSEEVFYKHIP
jgi:hypothetical protein